VSEPAHAAPRGDAVAVGLLLSATEDFRDASHPLFAEGIVDRLMWNLDLGWSSKGIPAWAAALLDVYGEAERLHGHGVELSLFSSPLTARQTRWLDRFAEEMRARRYQRVTEHIGFITAGPFENGTVFPHPRCHAALAVGRDRLARLSELAGMPVGLENLALALSRRDVDEQPDFLEALLAPTNGHLLLDLHNLLCQAENFEVDPIALLRSYPLHRVREIHLAGGEIDHPASDPRKRPFRRDSHMDHLPEGVFTLLDEALTRCPSLEAIFFEHADGVLARDEDQARFHDEFRRVRARVGALRGNVPIADEEASRPPPRAPIEIRAWTPREDASIGAYQAALLTALDEAPDPQAVRSRLLEDTSIVDFHFAVEDMEPRALEVGQSLIHLWGDRRRARPERAMRALTFTGPHRRLSLLHAPLPTPSAGEVRIRVFASGVCGTDVHMQEGSFPTPCPIVPGHEPVGVIDALGEGVTALRVGDRVGVPWVQEGCGACEACARQALHQCQRPLTWMHRGGGHAEWMIARARGCVRLPDDLPFELAAPLFCAGFTVMSGLRRAASRHAKKRVGVLGLGGLGHLAIQVARAEGHEVIAITSSASKRRGAMELGASDVLVVQDDVGRELAAIGGLDVLLGTSNDLGATSRALAGLRPEGTLVTMGLPSVEPSQLVLDPRRMMGRGLSVIGGKQGPREDLHDLLAYAARGEVRPVVETYPITQVARAMQRLSEQRVRYRAVLLHSSS
jgi:D-arabinose 1-dehydrogenase-like Zn-dependent alcohol dehydrogenase/uncharacterized protein (UPF0276 family)